MSRITLQGHVTQLIVKTMKRNEVQPGKHSVTESVTKTMSSGSSGMTEVMFELCNPRNYMNYYSFTYSGRMEG